MTNGLLTSARRKQFLSMKCKKHPNNLTLALHYKKYKNNFTKIIRLAKNNFYEQKFKSVSSNPKSTWNLINEVTGSKLRFNDDIVKLKNNECEVNVKNDPITASNMFNNFFINITQNNIKKPINSEISHVPYNVSFNDVFQKKIKSSDILDIINSFKDDTASGLDKVSVKMLKCINKFIVDPLVYIYNLSIEQSIFPDTLKVADVKPLFKNGDKSIMSNYRPISMLSNFSKIFEKIIKARLIEFLEKNNLLSKNQYGFRPGLSTENALYKVTQFLYSNLDKSNKSLAIFLDIAKAFDTVNHQILFNILPSFGINNSSLNWFKSYLHNRKQSVKINEVNGNTYGIKNGVPQGSVLGPILFIIYINEICNINFDGSIVTYADDTCLLFSHKSWGGVYEKACRGFNQIINFLNNRNLSLNVDKTVFMPFSINKTDCNFNTIAVHGCVNNKMCSQENCKIIKMVGKIRYLGVIFDNNLKWNFHINNLLGKLRFITFKLIKLKNMVPKQTMKIVYFALYQSNFQYGLLVWGGLRDNILNALVVNQNNIVRICLNKFTLEGSTKANYRELGVLPIRLLYKKIAIMYLVKKFNLDKYHNKLSNKRELRKYDLTVNYTNKSFGQCFVDYLGPTFFNSMPFEFKKKLLGDERINIKGLVYKYLFLELNNDLM